MCEVSLYLSFQATSTDVQHDLPGSFIRSDNLARAKVKFSNWPFGVKMQCFGASRHEEYDGVKHFLNLI